MRGIRKLLCNCSAVLYKKGRCIDCYRANERRKSRQRRGTDPAHVKIGKLSECVTCHKFPPSDKSRLGLCDACMREDRAEKTRLREREYRAKVNATKPPVPVKYCECGCGGAVRTGPYKFATKECARQSAKPSPKRKVAAVKPTFRASDKPKPAPLVERIINPGVQVTRVASAMPDRLRDMFGEHGCARLATDDYLVLP